MPKVFRKKRNKRPRSPQLKNERTPAYHYSANRTGVDRLFDRGVVEEKPNNRQQRRIKRLVFYIVLFLSIVGILYLTTLSREVDITVQGPKGIKTDQSAVADKTEQILARSLLNRSKLTIKDQAIADELVRAFPELSSVRVTTSLFAHRAKATLYLARPAVLLANGSHIFLVDDSGKILADTTENKPSYDTSKLPLIQDQYSRQLEIGKPALTRSQITYVEEIHFQSNQKSLAVESMIMHSGGGELSVRYAGLKYFVKFNLFEDPRKSVGTFLSVREQLERDKINPTEYIDVRLPGRAYVK